MADAATMSKSARKRANQKARAAEADLEESAPPAPEPAPKSKAAAKPKAEPAPAAEPKASAKGKAKAKAEPKAAEPAPAPKAEPKAKGKAAAAPKAAAPPAPKAEAKAAAKGKAKAKAKAKEEEEEAKQEKSNARVFYAEEDDGSRADEWETSTGLSNKRSKQKERQDEKKLMEKDKKAAGVVEARANQHIPGLAPAEVQVAQAKGKAGAKAKPGAKAATSQLVTSIAVVTPAAAAAKDKEPEKAAAPDNSVSATVKIPEKRIGVVVGPKGANITMIKEKTGVKTIDLAGDVCTILGPPEGVALAEQAVRQLVDKGYMSLAYEDFEEEGVPVLPTDIPNIIGSKGAIIQVIKKECKVEIDMPAVPKNPLPGKKFKVMLAGSKTAVAQAKEVVNMISSFGYHPITHPGFTHKEMEVEEWRYRFLIGSKGSEMRHIQNNYKVKVNIPREHSVCQNVVICGEERDVERAIKYIEKVLYEADQPKGRGAPEQASDPWGDEAEVEDWMKPYMYQRK